MNPAPVRFLFRSIPPARQQLAHTALALYLVAAVAFNASGWLLGAGLTVTIALALTQVVRLGYVLRRSQA